MLTAAVCTQLNSNIHYYNIIHLFNKNSKNQWFDKLKYLSLSVAQFMYIIRKRIQLAPEKAMFLFVNRMLPTTRYGLTTACTL